MMNEWMKLNYNIFLLFKFKGVTYPACHGIWRFWAPPLERSRLATMAFSGSYAGVVLGMPMSGILTGWISWQAPFYFYGVVGVIWYGAWLWLTFEKPRNHPTITPQELKYIEKSLGDSVQIAMPTIATTPWKAFFTSMPVYAIIVANFCRSWNFYLLVLYQSAYLKKTFDFRIEEVSQNSFLKDNNHKYITLNSISDWYGGSTSTFSHDCNCTIWRYAGWLSPQNGNTINNKRP